MVADRRAHVVYIAYVDMTGSSGENVFSRELARAIARQPDVRLTLIAPEPDQPLPEDFSAQNVAVRFLPRKVRGSMTWAFRIQWATFKRLRQARRHFGPPAGCVVTLRPATLLPPLLARLSGTPQVLVVEGLEARNVSRMTSFPGAAAVMTLIAWFNAVCSRRVMVAYGAIREWLAALPLVGADRLELFSHGVDPSMFPAWDPAEARRELGLRYETDDFVVGFVGSYKWYHSLDVLIGALARPEMQGVKALLVGEGPEREAVTQLLTVHGLQDRVLQAGLVPYDRIGTYIGACDLMFGARAPQHWSNPIKLIEYLAAGRLVIGYRTSEAEFIEEMGFGALLEDVTPQSVAEAILRFRSLDPSKRRDLEDRARHHIRENRTWDVLAARLVQSIRRERVS